MIPISEYEKLVNCEKPRKRRTTANPQFSHAAIEAKRITKLEVANERKNRRQMALLKHNFKPNKNQSFHFQFLKSQKVFNSENELFPGKLQFSLQLIN